MRSQCCGGKLCVEAQTINRWRGVSALRRNPYYKGNIGVTEMISEPDLILDLQTNGDMSAGIFPSHFIVNTGIDRQYLEENYLKEDIDAFVHDIGRVYEEFIDDGKISITRSFSL